MQNIRVVCELKVYENLENLDDSQAELIHAAIAATETAHAPYSLFHVGCALRFEDGEILSGSNQENLASPSGLCAERVALFAAGAKYPGRRITEMAVTAVSKRLPHNEPLFPCGACLQVISETENMQGIPIRIMLLNPDKTIYMAEGLQTFLPFRFSAKQLKRDG